MDQTPSTIFFGGTQLHDADTLTPSPLAACYSDQLAGRFFHPARAKPGSDPDRPTRVRASRSASMAGLGSPSISRWIPFQSKPGSQFPHLEGSLTWDGPTLWFTPLQQLDPNQVYQVAISAGAQSIHGHKLWKSITWQASVREPALLYLVLDTDEGGLYRLDFSTGESVTSKQMKSFLGRSVRMEY
ncbi:MAG TPA: Ig-like domain-containing protein [Brevefilum sp.]|nr:Ig-like domain-containing protein [Brevefilum sp.]HOR18489.1 Ig-like domain-containing protein [Brevefilum sp.]HPL69116.1 Ig-like domain-containing protein [Brevefilum sp.]